VEEEEDRKGREQPELGRTWVFFKKNLRQEKIVAATRHISDEEGLCRSDPLISVISLALSPGKAPPRFTTSVRMNIHLLEQGAR